MTQVPCGTGEVEKIAIEERACKKRLDVDPPAWWEIEKIITDKFEFFFPKLEKVQRLTTKEYVEREQVTAQAKREDLEADKRLKNGQVNMRKESKLQSFTKLEQNYCAAEVGSGNFAEEGDYKRYIPRVIIGVKAVMRVILGRWAVPIQKQLGKIWDGSNGIMFESGRSQEDVGRFVTTNFNHFGRAIKTDLSRCDMHWSYQAYKAIEFVLLRFGVDKLFMAAWQQFYENQRGESRHGQSWTRASGMLGTGVALTTVCNTLINAFQIVYAATEQGLTLGVDYVFILRGDDALIFSSKLDVTSFRASVRLLGFKSKAESVTRFSKLSFCSQLFVPTYVSLAEKLYVPTPTGKCMFKLGSSPFITWKYHQQFCTAVAKSLTACSRPNPLLSAYLDAMIRIGGGQTFTPRMQAYFEATHRLKYKQIAPAGSLEATSEALDTLAERYDLPRDLITRVIAQLGTITEAGLLGSPEISQLAAAVARIDL